MLRKAPLFLFSKIGFTRPYFPSFRRGFRKLCAKLPKLLTNLFLLGYTELNSLQKCEESTIGISDHVDFVLLFYMVHEVPNKEELFNEIKTILKQNGQVLIVEPPFHVSKSEFEETVRKAKDIGFVDIKGPNVLFSKTVILKNS